MTQTWHFPTLDGGEAEGVNDSARETFEGDHERYIARECIQNSLDARFNYDKPVHIEFRRFNVPTNSVPGVSELREILGRAKDFSMDQERSERFYDAAMAMINQEYLSVLRISDYNTTGLTGNDDDTSGGWYRLVRATGVSSATGDGGGSFGIGKGAPFASSVLRTVYYSTLNQDGGVAFQGKARLSSFKNADGDIRRGIGQFGQQTEGQRGVSAIRELNGIPEIFQRHSQGTDVFIVGYEATDEQWAQAILKSVLDSFWMAIYDNTLTVDIIDDDKILYSVNASSIDELINEYASSDEYTKLFYQSVVQSSEKFEDELPLLGKVELYVRIGEGPKHIQCMRRSLMKIHTMNRLRVMPDDFVGTFIVRGEVGNRNLRNLEPPAHDKWDEKRGNNNHASQEALKNARDWIIASLKELADKRMGVLEEIPELSKYLPEDIERDDLDEVTSNSGKSATDDAGNRETADLTSSKNTIESMNPKTAMTKRSAIIKPATPSSDPKADQRLGSHSGKGSGHPGGSSPEPTGTKKYIDTTELEVRAIESYRDGKRVYVFNIRPNQDDHGTLRIIAQADDGTYNVDIDKVTDNDGNNYHVENGQIEGLELKQGEKKQLVVELKSNRRYALGVA